tara:strand:+ start:245 stop:481 length:237 start_codon:yes stop_codon:yes gene_type:complete
LLITKKINRYTASILSNSFFVSIVFLDGGRLFPLLVKITYREVIVIMKHVIERIKQIEINSAVARFIFSVNNGKKRKI